MSLRISRCGKISIKTLSSIKTLKYRFYNWDPESYKKYVQSELEQKIQWKIFTTLSLKFSILLSFVYFISLLNYAFFIFKENNRDITNTYYMRFFIMPLLFLVCVEIKFIRIQMRVVFDFLWFAIYFKYWHLDQGNNLIVLAIIR